MTAPSTVDGGMSRRGALAGTAAALASACTANRLLPPASQELADAHVHLFNMADLPAGNFLNYVAIPEKFHLVPPPWAEAIVDLVATLLRFLAPTAKAELASMNGVARLREITPEEFGQKVAAHIEGKAGAKELSGAPTPLSASYQELSRAILADSAQLHAERTAGLDAAAIAQIARKAEGGPVQPGDVARALTPLDLGYSFGDAAHLLGWAYILLKSRGEHVERYRRRFATASMSPSLLFNHLVDYDKWLDDSAAKGSDLLTQVAAMDRLRSRSSALDMRLYAGVCPLRLALERLEPGPTTFDRLLAAHEAGQVYGFKMYPPMGFRPIGNAGLSDEDFNPKSKGRVTALDLWKQAKGPKPLGQALDDALREIYRACVSRNIPIMAHAANSNGAGPYYAHRANPLYWRDVVAEFPIKLTLGHLVDDVAQFIAAVDAGIEPPEVWSLFSSTKLLDPALSGPRVYGDLAYTEELMTARDIARDFFVALRTAFGKRDPDLTRILYGTDWIMLGLERHDERYLDCIMRGMSDAKYSAVQQQNILGENLRRFLAP